MIHKALHPRDEINRQYVSRKERGRGLASLEDSVDVSIQGLKDCIKKCKERLIIEANNSTDNVWIKRTITETSKQKWAKK